MLSRVRPPPGARPGPLTAQLAAGLPRLGAPQVASDGTVVFPQTDDGLSRLMAVRDGCPARVLSGDAAPMIGTLGTATFALHPRAEECAYVDQRGRLVAVDMKGGPARVLYADGGGSPRYSPDGSLVAFAAARASGPAVAVVDRARPDWPAPVTPPLPAAPIDLDWHPAGRALAVHFTDPEQMPWDCGEIWYVPLDGPARPIVPATPGRFAGSPRWLDADTLLYVTDRDGWLNLWRVELSSGRSDPVLSEPREALYPAVSPDGRRVAFVSRKAGDARLAVLDIASGQVRDLHPEAGLHGTWFFGPGERIGWVPDSSAAVTTFSAPGLPPRVGSFPLNGGAQRWWTDHGLPPAVTELFAPAEELTWERAGMTLHGWLRRPAASDDRPRPLAVHLHGGPTGDAALWWYAPVDHLVAAGWAVLDVNYRGSVGFGRDYVDALIGGWGRDEVEDAAAGVLAARAALGPEVLSSRTAVFGVSAGGFSTMACLLAHPEIFMAGVAGCGVYDLSTLAEHTVPAQAYYLERLLGPAAESYATYVDNSPLTRAHELSRPVLVWHGTAASATPIDQAERLVGALAAAGREHEFKVYEGEGYGGLRVATSKARLDDTLAFLGRTVLDRPGPT